MQNNTLKEPDESRLLLSRFSHEIRNPISLINSELQMIEETHPEVASYRYWNDIMDNLEYTKILLNNLSEYNNADRLMPRKTDFHRYLSSLISSIRPTCEYLGIALDVQIPDTLPAIFIDQVKLKQAPSESAAKCFRSRFTSWWKNILPCGLAGRLYSHFHKGQWMRHSRKSARPDLPAVCNL